MASATARRASGVAGMPLSSMHSAITAAPYSATSGSTAASLSLSPFTELISARPLTTFSAAARAAGLAESRQTGKSTASCTIWTARGSRATSSTLAAPTFTSNTIAPASAWSSASRGMRLRSPA